MAKPFSVELLYERISAVLRRSAGEKDREVFCYRGLTVDLGKMQVFREGEQVKLSGTEYRILELLIRNRSQVMTREMLLQKIWDFEENYVDENTLNVYREHYSSNESTLKELFGNDFCIEDITPRHVISAMVVYLRIHF